MKDSQHQQNPNPMDEWEQIFEDNDSTRVLEPMDEPAVSASSRESDDGSAPGTDTAEFEPISSDPTAPLPAAIARQRRETQQDDADSFFEDEDYQEADTAYFYNELEHPLARYRRLQILPCLLGWLAGYSLLSAGLGLSGQLLTIFGAEDFGSVGSFLDAVEGGAQQATPWLIATGLPIALGYGVAGYTASRLARYVATRQGLGVVIVGFAVSAVLSIYELLPGMKENAHLSFQYLTAGDFPRGIVGMLLYFTLALIAAFVGSLVGKNYEKQHQKYV